MKRVHLAMIRESLEDIPQFPLPAGYRLRWYRPGDKEAWLRIHVASDRFNTFTAQTFDQQFGRDSHILAQRQCYLCDGVGNEIGTATAWFDEAYHGRPFGRVHWVAIVPEMQGKGLARPLLTAVCNRLRNLGHVRAYLTTDSPRIAAVNLYLKFGFVPQIRAEGELAAWRGLREHIKPHYWRRAVAAMPELG